MLRKQESNNQLQILQAKVNELETEIKNLKSSFKYNSSHQQAGHNQFARKMIDKPNIRNIPSSNGQGISEEKLAKKMLEIFTSSFKKPVPSSFMR
jgi:hypothetical protein